MNAMPKTLTTKVFRAGNSQALRIPKAFDLPEGEMLIEHKRPAKPSRFAM